MDLDCIASFLVVAKEGHFGRAAAQLQLSSPALTKRIQRLERQVGIRLIERGPAGMLALTDAGSRFARAAGPLLTQARRAQSAAREQPKAWVRLGVPGRIGDSPARSDLMQLSLDLQHLLPGVRLECVSVPYSMGAVYLLQRRVDVLWTTSGITDPRLSSVPLTFMWRVGVVAKTHELADAMAVSVDDFTKLPMLHNPSVPPGLMNQGCLADYRPLSDTQLVTTTALDLPALIQCVALGLGVAAVPAVLAPKLGSDVKVLSLVGAAPCELHAVRRRSDTSEPVLELLRLLSPVAIKAALEPQAAGQAFHPG